MFVCLCHGVSDKKIKQLVEGGMSSVKQIQQTCKAGSDCGQCLAQVKDFISEASKSKEDPTSQES